ncbi:MAG: hypothetical protein R6U44_06845 [Archaeoglobaceae archaeon]
MRDSTDTAALQYRYYMIVLSNSEAVVSFDIETENIKILECTNREFCFYNRLLRCGKCPHTCKVIVETKNHIYGRRETRSSIFEVKGIKK